ncbi:TolC family protein [Colwellia sp. MEBiC06753]
MKQLCYLLFLFLPMSLVAQPLTLQQAVALAQQNDPWHQGNSAKQAATLARSKAASTLPDPQLSISAMNLPTDGWQFNQEAMTQLKVGVSQMLPRGDSLAIKQAQLSTQASSFPLLSANRVAQVKQQVSQLWLDAYLAQTTINLINKDKVLFEQMVEIAEANYTTTLGKTRQQDVIRAQLELVRLDDLLVTEQQKLDTAIATLSEWLTPVEQNQSHSNSAELYQHLQSVAIAQELPKLTVNYSQIVLTEQYNQQQLAQIIAQHPAVQAIDVKQQVAKKGVELAKQSYKPQWGVNASYAYRDDAPNGMSRADFFSVGVTFDLPLFTENRQDQEVTASVAESEAVYTEKLLLMRNIMAQVDKELRNLNRIHQRQSLYQQQLVSQSHEQAQAALTAYTNDDGSFADVVSARITELNTTIAKIKIDVDALKTITRLNYLLTKPHTHLAMESNHAN